MPRSDSTAAPAARGQPPRSSALAGRVVVVTGGSSGIGRAIALAAAQAGADVAITFRSREGDAQEVARRVEGWGRRAAVFPLDLADERSIDTLVTEVVAVFGHADGWVNNAGADILTGPLADRSELEKLDLLLAVDLRGTMIASWRAAHLMAGQSEGGAIVNISWDHVLSGMEGRNPEMFAAVKGGVLSFSKSLARSAAPHVRVNVVAPGWIETAFGAGLDEARRSAVAEATPLKRWGTPEDVAGAAVFLLSPAASFVTGEVILVGGGVVM